MSRASFVLLLAAVAALPACRRETPAFADDSVPTGEVRFAPNSPKLAAIGIDTVRQRRDKVVAVLPAQLALDEDHTVRVASPVAGRIVRLDAAPGERVASGGALAHILSADVAQAQSDLERAEASLATATAALDGFRTARGLAERYEAGLLASARAALETSRYAYGTGAISLVELLDAIQAYLDTESDYYTAVHDYWVNLFALGRAAGRDFAP